MSDEQQTQDRPKRQRAQKEQGVNISLVIPGKRDSVNLTLEQAKFFYQQLDNLFGTRSGPR